MGRNFDDYPGPGQKTPAKVYVLQYIDICSDAVFHARMWVKKIVVKFVFSKKATKFDKIFTVDLTLTTYCQIGGEDFVNFCGLLYHLGKNYFFFLSLKKYFSNI